MRCDFLSLKLGEGSVNFGASASHSNISFVGFVRCSVTRHVLHVGGTYHLRRRSKKMCKKNSRLGDFRGVPSLKSGCVCSSCFAPGSPRHLVSVLIYWALLFAEAGFGRVWSFRPPSRKRRRLECDRISQQPTPVHTPSTPSREKVLGDAQGVPPGRAAKLCRPLPMRI